MTDPNPKRQRMWIILCTAIFLLAMGVMCRGILELEATPTHYTSPVDSTVEFTIDNGKYYLNGTKLERVETSFFQELKDCGKSWVPSLPYIIPAALLFVLVMQLSSKMPPTRIWTSLFGYHKEAFNGRISLRRAPGGLIAWRVWRGKGDGILTSVVQGTKWGSATSKADTKPEAGNDCGIYAYRLGVNGDTYRWFSLPTLSKEVLGIVSLSGHIVGHQDSRLRAENCTILTLITKHPHLAHALEERYKCPVVITSNPKHALSSWTLGKEGVFWLSHNARVIEERLQAQLDQDIATLPVYQSF